MIKKKIRRQLAELLQHVRWLNAFYTKWKWRERTVSLGKENPDKIFFVIRRANCKAGLFSFVMTNMAMVKYALDRGYIPVVDMQTEKNTYLDEDQVGKRNVWEFYFEQPCGCSLNDIAKSRKVILGCGLIGDNMDFPGDSITRNPDEYRKWRKLFDQYFIVKEDIIEEAESLKKELFQGQRVLGVLCRGTDYVNTRPKDHPIQPSADQMIEKVRAVMREQKCACIYLATEDADIYERFQKEFGELVKTLRSNRYSNTGKENINDIAVREGGNRYQMGRQYLISILLLAGCSCLVAGSAGGTYGALLMGPEYDYQYIFDLGTY